RRPGRRRWPASARTSGPTALRPPHYGSGVPSPQVGGPDQDGPRAGASADHREAVCNRRIEGLLRAPTSAGSEPRESPLWFHWDGQAIGAALACPDRTVGCFSGDGSLLVNLQELAVAAEENVNVKVVLLNNNALGLVRQQQELLYGWRVYV